MRGVRFCKVYDMTRRGMKSFEVRHKDALQFLSHAGVWRSMFDCTL